MVVFAANCHFSTGTFLAKGIRRFARCGGLRHRSTIPSLAVSAGGIVVLIQIFVNELRGLYCMMQEVYCAAFIGFFGFSLPPPPLFFFLRLHFGFTAGDQESEGT